MFDVGFWEVALIGIVALLVVGPERLPALARNVGRWVGQVRRYVAHVKQDIEREIHADEMRQLIEKPDSMGSGLSELREVAKETASSVQDLRRGLDEAMKEGEKAVDVPRTGAGDAARAAKGERAIPHHAVDDDPFAASQPAAPAPRPPTPDDAATAQDSPSGTDPAPGTTAPDHEQASEPTRRD